jgi:hypothetical protein
MIREMLKPVKWSVVMIAFGTGILTSELCAQGNESKSRANPPNVESSGKDLKHASGSTGVSTPQPGSIKVSPGLISVSFVETQKSADADKKTTLMGAPEDLVSINSALAWQTIFREDFEGSFPSGNNWDIRHATNAPYFWNDVNVLARTGNWSGWCAGGTITPNPVLNPAADNYVNNMDSWMIYGPFDLSDATDAKLDFWYWLDSETNFDYLWWAASTSLNGTYSGFGVSGNSNGYQFQSFDLKNVPTLGNLTGRSQVYVTFFFRSDASVTLRGAFLDDITLQKFVSTQESIRLTSPNGGEVWQVGSLHDITWTSSGTSGNVSVELSTNGGSSWTLIFPNLVDDGLKEDWEIPNTPSDNCLLRITDTDGFPTDRSDGVFRIVPQPVTESIRLISPNGGEVWQVGSRHDITWTSSGTSGRVSVELSTNGGSSWTPIFPNLVDDGLKEDWEIPNTPSDNCLLRITDIDGSPSDRSNGAFTILSSPNSFIRITSPSAGDNWQMGTTRTIRWESQNTGPLGMRIQLYRNGAFVQPITDFATGGHYDWQIPTNLVSDNNYQIRVSSTTTSDVDFSDFFTISGSTPFIIVISPNGGENWPIGSIQNIRWTSSGTSGRVSVELSTNGGVSWTPIFPDLVDDGIKEWTVPNTPSNNCLIRITDTDGSPSDRSDGPFRIVGPAPSITVTSPSTGDIWQGGTSRTISWISENAGSAVQIQLYRGDLFQEIANNTPNDGSHNWSIAPNLPDASNYRVRITSISTSADDFSDNFTIFGAPEGEIRPIVASPRAVGAEFWVDITVSSVQDLLGISFQLNYTQTAFVDVVLPHSSNVVAGPFLGTDLVFVPNVDETAGNVSIGVTRKVGQGGVSGSGVVARVRFRSLPSTPNGTEVVFSLSDIAANDAAGNPIPLVPSNAVVRIEQIGPVVWPGDTNNDGIVNQADILRIGLYWNFTGPARQNASINWTGQPATAWSPQASTYADANGNGVVNQADVLPIGLNWGQSHSVSTQSLKSMVSLPKLSSPNAAGLQINIVGEANPGEDFWVEILASDVTNLFGVSFEFVYSPTDNIDTVSVVEPGILMGNDLVFIFDAIASGRIGIGISRKAGQGGVSGSGIVARIMMRMSSNTVVGQDTTEVCLENVEANDPDGNATPFDTSNVVCATVITDVQAAEINIPDTFSLRHNYPNPFNPETNIHYGLPEAADVTLQVFNIRGQLVRTLVEEFKSAGFYTVRWDGKDAVGISVPSGPYFYRIKAGDKFVQTSKMTLLK